MIIILTAEHSAAGVIIEAPAYPECRIVAEHIDDGLARMRGAVEAAIGARLLRGEPIPASAELPAPPATYELHINLAHFEAMASHQRRNASGAGKQ